MNQSQFLATQAGQYTPVYDLEKAKKLQAIKQAMASTNNDYQSGIDSINQDKANTMPTFQVQRDQTDATIANQVQSSRNKMASDGLYRSGTMVSDEANANNQRNTLINNIDTSQNQFTSGLSNRLAELERAKAQQLTDLTNQESLANQEYAGNISAAQNKAMADYQAMQASQSAGTKLTATQQKNANTSNAYGDVDEAIRQGTSWQDILNNISSNAAGYAAAGLNYSTILSYAQQRYNDMKNMYAAQQSTPEALAQRNTNSLTRSAFKNWMG